MLLPVSHVLPLTVIERRRLLPVAGTVLVRSGQEVDATEVIATADIYAEHISLDIARGLGVAKNKVPGLLRRKIGEEIQQGDVIASRPGMVTRTVRAPKDGKLVAVGGGQALMQVSRTPYKLQAGIPGKVFKVEADYGAIIRMTGAWIQGVWGNGRLETGGLYVAADSPEHVVSVRDLDPSQRGQVMFGGHCANGEVLEGIYQIKMKGLILGSLSTRLRPMAAQMPYPIMVLEGFGNIPINEVAYILLSTSAERSITLNAAKYDRATGERPEAVIPVTGQGEVPMPLQLAPLDVGTRVHILRDPHQGRVGTVRRILGVTRLENGLHADSVEVEISTVGGEEEQEERTVVPLANLEVIG
ncbi:MAG: hypothetical protein JW757_12830 [Anaerolineales bacterium]|nr:hypothetical protein [Anaerolineales bacterium]